MPDVLEMPERRVRANVLPGGMRLNQKKSAVTRDRTPVAFPNYFPDGIAAAIGGEGTLNKRSGFGIKGIERITRISLREHFNSTAPSAPLTSWMLGLPSIQLTTNDEPGSSDSSTFPDGSAGAITAGLAIFETMIPVMNATVKIRTRIPQPICLTSTDYDRNELSNSSVDANLLNPLTLERNVPARRLHAPAD